MFVKEIEIEGIKYPFIINWYVIGEFQKETGKKLDEFISNLKEFYDHLYMIEPLLYHAIRVAQIVSKVDVTITRDDMPMLLIKNETYGKILELVNNFYPKEDSEEITSSDKKK